MNKTLRILRSFFVFTLAIPVFSLIVFNFSSTLVYAEGSFVFTGHLELGVVGNDVKELQTLLNAKGYSVGIPDGKFGPTTKDKVMLFQKDNGLKSDGIIGERVRAFLNGTSTITPTTKVVTKTKTQTPAVTTSQTPVSLERTLKLITPRMSGDDVKDLQIFLNSKGYDTGTPDGVFGVNTQAQVKLFQVANNLTVDGSVGSKTRVFMNTLAQPTSTSSISSTSLTSQPATGCISGALFNVTTGKSCTATQLSVLPTGCTTTNIYSTTTGVSCETGLPPTPVIKYSGGGSTGPRIKIINNSTISGVTIPAQGEAPVSTLAGDTQYTATIAWGGTPSAFLASTSYTATITIVPKDNYTLTGVTANFFTVAGATTTNSVDGGIVTAVFPATPLKQLSISAPTITNSKAYDGNTGAVVTVGTLAGITSGETVTVSAVANYDTKNIGTGKSITVVYTLVGADASHYIKPADYTVSTGEVTIIPLTIANPTLTTSKQYDRTVNAVVTAGALIGKISGDDVSVSAVATYDTVNVGSDKTITVVYTIVGASMANYVRPVDYTSSSGVITAVQLTDNSPALTTTKVYDTTTTAVVTAGSLIGVISGDTVTVSAVASYDTAIAGTGKTITTVYTLGGAQLANYIKPVNYVVDTGIITAIINTPAISGVTIPVAGETPVSTLADGTGYSAIISWSGTPVTFAGDTVYTATITITAKTGYTLTGVTDNFFTVAGTSTPATNSADSGVVSAVFPATVSSPATTPSYITLDVGSTAPVGGVTNVSIPVAEGTDTTGVITGYVATSADNIKFTVVDGGSATSSITINGGGYTSGADYQVVPTTSMLSVVVTTTEAGKLTATRTFTIAGPILGADGLTYGVVTGADNKIWLDRNLGATQVATSFDDYQAYGNLYQWGRGADGHELINHTTATEAMPQNSSIRTLSATDTPGDALFIKILDFPYDWRSPQNDNLWQGVNGTNNVCPAGFRLPTSDEQQALVTAAGLTNLATAFSSSLKFTAAGAHEGSYGGVYSFGTNGRYWSSSVSSTSALGLEFNAISSYPAGVAERTIGLTVRCLKD